MKKTVKSLIIASSVAAIAGIGAVSFAKWEATTANKTKQAQNNALGDINIVEFDNSTLTALTDILPYDQDDTYDASDYKTHSLTVVPTADKNYTLKIKTESWSASLEANSELYVLAQKSSDTAPTLTADYEFSTNGWRAVKASEVSFTTFTSSDTALTVYFALKSDKKADRKKTFTIVYTVEARV